MATPTDEGRREGSLQAPTRHALDWRNPAFYDEHALTAELERVFDICHGCRRCVNLCQSFPTLFDLVDESPTLEVDGIKKEDYWKVVDHCYLCDLCFMTKCPYVPPHEWNVDFPHLMLRAKAVKFQKGDIKLRDRLLTSTDTVGKLAGIPIVVQTVNASNKTKVFRKALDKVLGVHPDAILPEYHSRTFRKRYDAAAAAGDATPTASTRGRVALYATCYGNYNEPQVAEDLVAVFRHNGIPVTIAEKEQCCGMPKLELGDLEAVARAKEANIPVLAKLVDEGLGHRGAGAVVRAHVQAGTAAHVPGRPGRAEGEEGDVRSLRVPDAAPQRGQTAHRLQAAARQGRLPRALPPARAEHRPQDA